MKFIFSSLGSLQGHLWSDHSTEIVEMDDASIKYDNFERDNPDRIFFFNIERMLWNYLNPI